MRVISRSRLNEFAARHEEVRAGLDSWYHIMKRATFQTPHDVQQQFPSSSFLGEGVTIFNIGSCRLEVQMRYDLDRVYIRSVDTHEDYDRRNKRRKK